jgi:von Willebrand factor type A domain
MANTNRTHITAVLDRSGSMRNLEADTIGGFNKFLEDQKATEGEATLTLVLFDDNYEVPFLSKNLKDIPELTNKVYFARGMTALYDALGKAIIETGKTLAAIPEDMRPGTVIVLVMTDGEENSSKEFAGEPGRQRLAAMVKTQTEVYKWAFIFMGANIDAKAVGASIGVESSRSLNYTADKVGTRAVYEVMSSGTKGLRDHARTRGTKGSTNFVDDADAVIGAQPPASKSTKLSGTPTK